MSAKEPHCWHRLSPRVVEYLVEGWTEYQCCNCGDFFHRFWRRVPIATPDHGPYFKRHRVARNDLPKFGCGA